MRGVLEKLPIIIAFIGIAVVLLRRATRRRHQKLAELARRHGLGFEPYATAPVPPALRDREDSIGTELLRGRLDGLDATLFCRRHGTGKQATHQTVATVALRRTDLPAFLLEPEGPAAKLLAWLGAQDIDFEDTPDFSRRFRLRGPDEQRVRSAFQQSIRMRLERMELPRGLRIESFDGQLACWVPRAVLRPDDMPARLRLATELGLLFGA